MFALSASLLARSPHTRSFPEGVAGLHVPTASVPITQDNHPGCIQRSPVSTSQRASSRPPAKPVLLSRPRGTGEAQRRAATGSGHTAGEGPAGAQNPMSQSPRAPPDMLPPSRGRPGSGVTRGGWGEDQLCRRGAPALTPGVCRVPPTISASASRLPAPGIWDSADCSQ